MKRLALAAAILLAGCNQGATVTKGADGSVTVQKDGATITVGSKDCARASFVPIYADAKVTTCVADSQNAGEKRGTLIYTSAAAPAALLGWYKTEAGKAGLKVNLQTDMNLSASEGRRKLMVMAMTQGSETQVSVNWSE